MKIYKIASEEQYEHLSQFQLKQLMQPLKNQYSQFLEKRWKIPLTPQEQIEMKNIGEKLDNLGNILQNKINQEQENTKQLLKQNKPHEVTPSNFMKHHYTGSIASNAYDKYKTKEGINWLGNINQYPILIKSQKYNNEIIEFRKRNEPLKYVKTDQNDEIMRDEKGLALTMSLEEMKEKEYPLYDTTIVAFNQNKEPIGWVADEFGADGVWVIEEYQGKGIGTDLLHIFRKQFKPDRRIGQMTNKGIQMTKKYHKKLVEEALKEGKYVPEDILQEYGLI